MPIGTPIERYAVDQVTTSPVTFSPASTVAAGTVAVIMVANTSNKFLSAVSDDAGNTWTVDATGSDTAKTGSAASCQVVGAITTSKVVTLTFSNGTNTHNGIWLFEVSGLATTSAFDKTAFGQGLGTTLSSGATPTLSQADEIVFAVSREDGGGAVTAGSGFTLATTNTLIVGLALCEWGIVASTTAVTATATDAGNGGLNYVMLAATYKGAAAVVASPAAVPPQFIYLRKNR